MDRTLWSERQGLGGQQGTRQKRPLSSRPFPSLQLQSWCGQRAAVQFSPCWPAADCCCMSPQTCLVAPSNCEILSQRRLVKALVPLPETLSQFGWRPLLGRLGQGLRGPRSRTPRGAVTSVPADSDLPTQLHFCRQLVCGVYSLASDSHCTLCTESNIKARTFKRPSQGLKSVAGNGFSMELCP